MKIFGMKFAAGIKMGLAGAAMWMLPAAVLAQGMASIHGHVQNAVGQALTSGEVRLTTSDNPGAGNLTFTNTFPIDANGDYKGTGIKPGTYYAIVYQGTKHVDFIQTKLAAGEDKTVDFDMTRKEYVDKMSPEERQQMEDFKKKNAGVVATNAKIQNLNQLLKEAWAEIAAGNPEMAEKNMTEATVQKPDEPVLWSTLGESQLAEADAAAKLAKGATTPDSPAGQKYAAAAASYQKAISLYGTAAKPNPAGAAAANNQLGMIYSKIGKLKEAIAAYDAAAAGDHTKASTYYFNEAASLLNANDAPDAAVAADKVIAADPAKADAYYVKASALVQNVTVDPKTGKVTASPECIAAYQKYLELAPTGPHAQDVKDTLQGLGETIKQTYKAGKK